MRPTPPSCQDLASRASQPLGYSLADWDARQTCAPVTGTYTKGSRTWRYDSPCTGGGDPEAGSDLPTPWMKAVPDTRSDLATRYARVGTAVNGTPVPMADGTCGERSGVRRKRRPARPDGAIGREREDGQSSGILIQPCRMAYTTAWVRSLTESLRRIELMWFFTVCSLMDRA